MNAPALTSSFVTISHSSLISSRTANTACYNPRPSRVDVDWDIPSISPGLCFPTFLPGAFSLIRRCLSFCIAISLSFCFSYSSSSNVIFRIRPARWKAWIAAICVGDISVSEPGVEGEVGVREGLVLPLETDDFEEPATLLRPA